MVIPLVANQDLTAMLIQQRHGDDYALDSDSHRIIARYNTNSLLPPRFVCVFTPIKKFFV